MHRPALDIYSKPMVDLTEGLWRDLSWLFFDKGQIRRLHRRRHGAWEAVLSNALSRGDKVLLWRAEVSRSGGEMLRAMGAEVEVLKWDWARAVRPTGLPDLSRRARALQGY